MTKQDAAAILNHLGRKVRNNIATPEEEELFDVADEYMDMLSTMYQRAQRRPQSIWDLPMAEEMFRADAKDMGF